MIDTYIRILESFFTKVKYAKKPIVKIFQDGRIIGTDEQFASLNIVTIEDGGLNLPCPFIFDTKEITAFMRGIDNVSFDVPYGFYRSHPIEGNMYLQNHIEMNYKIDELYNRVVADELNKPIIYREDNFNESLPEMFSLKVSDGAKMYSFGVDKQFLMTSFNAIHPANKTDKVDLVIRDSDIYSYTAEFIIHKKKRKSINFMKSYVLENYNVDEM